MTKHTLLNSTPYVEKKPGGPGVACFLVFGWQGYELGLELGLYYEKQQQHNLIFRVILSKNGINKEKKEQQMDG